MSLRSGKLPFLGSEDEFLDHRSARTRSPGLECFTFAPTARTTPLTSRPRIAGNDNGKSFCRAPCRVHRPWATDLRACGLENNLLIILTIEMGVGITQLSLSASV